EPGYPCDLPFLPFGHPNRATRKQKRNTRNPASQIASNPTPGRGRGIPTSDLRGRIASSRKRHELVKCDSADWIRPRLERHEEGPALHRPALLHRGGKHSAAAGRTDLVLHLHGLENEQETPGRHVLADLDGDFHDATGHQGPHVLALVGGVLATL